MKILLALLVVCFVALTTMALTNFPDGVASHGIPLPADSYITTGKYIFVNNFSKYAQDSYPTYGTSTEKPLKTINYAITKCTSNAGDIIFVGPGHAETISTASAINLNKNGVRIIGMGLQRMRPKITWASGATVATCIRVNASDVSLENMVFDMSGTTYFVGAGAGTGGYSAGISVWSGASGFTFANNEVVVSSAIAGRVSNAIYLTGGTRTWIYNCNFWGGVSSVSTSDTAGQFSGVSSVIFIGSGVNDVEIGPNVRIRAYNAGKDSGLIEAASSRVSNFYLHDSELRQEYSGASCYRLSTAGLASGVIIKNLHTYYTGATSFAPGLSGSTQAAFWDSLGGPGDGYSNK